MGSSLRACASATIGRGSGEGARGEMGGAGSAGSGMIESKGKNPGRVLPGARGRTRGEGGIVATVGNVVYVPTLHVEKDAGDGGCAQVEASEKGQAGGLRQCTSGRWRFLRRQARPMG